VSIRSQLVKAVDRHRSARSKVFRLAQARGNWGQSRIFRTRICSPDGAIILLRQKLSEVFCTGTAKRSGGCYWALSPQAGRGRNSKRPPFSDAVVIRPASTPATRLTEARGRPRATCAKNQWWWLALSTACAGWSGPKSPSSSDRRSVRRVRARLTRLLMVPTAHSQIAAASS
jgi:hypothetical protein